MKKRLARIFVSGTNKNAGAVCFINGIDKTALKTLKNLKSNGDILDYELGTLISTTAATAKSLKIGECWGWKIANDPDKYYFTDKTTKYISAAITNIPKEAKNTRLYARAYVKIVNLQEESSYFYGEVENVTLQEAANKACCGAEKDLYSDKEKEIFVNFI